MNLLFYEILDVTMCRSLTPPLPGYFVETHIYRVTHHRPTLQYKHTH